jgi:hypothetical protein
VTDTWNVEFPASKLQVAQVWYKSVVNEGHFTLATETALSPYLASYYSGVSETSHVALLAHVLKAVQFWSKSDINEGQFTVETEKVFRPYLSLHCCRVAETWYVLTELALHERQLWLQLVCIERHFTLQAETVFLS